MARVLTIGDLHAPAVHPGYMDFCQDLYRDYGCNRVVFIGDVTDQHTASKHLTDPDGKGAQEEFEETYDEVQRWYEAFPKADVCIGNHDERYLKRCMEAGLPRSALKPYSELWDTPGWKWAQSFVIDETHYSHGTGCGGINPAFNYAKLLGRSVVIGHVHTQSGVKWICTEYGRTFSMDVGCGVDDQHPAFHYGKEHRTKGVLSAGVILDGTPVHHIMECGPGEPYSREHYE